MAQYSKKSGEKVEQAMHEMQEGKLKSGNSDKKVTSRKQAIAIGLSEARAEGDKAPKKAAAKKSDGSKKSATKKSAAPKKAAAKKSTDAKSATKKKRRAEESSQ